MQFVIVTINIQLLLEYKLFEHTNLWLPSNNITGLTYLLFSCSLCLHNYTYHNYINIINIINKIVVKRMSNLDLTFESKSGNDPTEESWGWMRIIMSTILISASLWSLGIFWRMWSTSWLVVSSVIFTVSSIELFDQN